MSRNLKMLVASVMVMLFVGNGVCTSAAQNIEPRVHGCVEDGLSQNDIPWMGNGL